MSNSTLLTGIGIGIFAITYLRLLDAKRQLRDVRQLSIDLIEKNRAVTQDGYDPASAMIAVGAGFAAGQFLYEKGHNRPDEFDLTKCNGYEELIYWQSLNIGWRAASDGVDDLDIDTLIQQAEQHANGNEEVL